MFSHIITQYFDNLQGKKPKYHGCMKSREFSFADTALQQGEAYMGEKNQPASFQDALILEKSWKHWAVLGFRNAGAYELRIVCKTDI